VQRGADRITRSTLLSSQLATSSLKNKNMLVLNGHVEATTRFKQRFWFSSSSFLTKVNALQRQQLDKSREEHWGANHLNVSASGPPHCDLIINRQHRAQQTFTTNATTNNNSTHQP
jgi:hypothetical protein